MKRPQSFLRTVPRKTLAISLVGAFFIFSTIGFANDIMDLGRQTPLRFEVLNPRHGKEYREVGIPP